MSGLYLITRGDDCGSNATVSRAILETIHKGMLRNVSLMAPCISIEDAATTFAAMSNVCFGVHLTVNAEWDNVRWGSVAPAASVPSLLDEDGFFHRTPEKMRQAGAKLEEVFIELDAQLNRLRGLGFTVSYADEHMLFGRVFEGFEERFAAWCSKHGLINHRRFMLRLPQIDAEGMDPVEQLIAQLEAGHSGIYTLVGHPAYDTEEMRQLGHEGYNGEQVSIGRDWERKMFTDRRILNYIKQKEIVPLRYDEAASVSAMQLHQ